MSNRLYVHVPIRLLIDHDDVSEIRAGAFATKQEAQQVLEHWRAEGHTSPMGIRSLPIWGTAAEWIAAGAIPASGVPDDMVQPVG
ncbi:hypothetical protein [Nocardioides nitrophenolicus]|uniref:hypothetical protein n=1 Tax=Nocardioides nitrophenolicus TaxID=60489 RepID=UPI00195672B9|nr:hypothetical protein [Nocardioides nitrophenolicus]MBM7519689.1 hypothetical protein [Nocardioides nitrophenolicus]